MEKKICTLCKDEKELSEFNKNKTRKDGHSNVCRTCSNNSCKIYYSNNNEHHKQVINKRKQNLLIENREKLFEYFKTHPCVDCTNDNPIVLEFDHRHPKDKEHNISKMINTGYSWDKIIEEIDKCDVRCANCHRIRTAKQYNWYNNLIKN